MSRLLQNPIDLVEEIDQELLCILKLVGHALVVGMPVLVVVSQSPSGILELPGRFHCMGVSYPRIHFSPFIGYLNSYRKEMKFGRQGRRVIEANFEGGALSSDGGLMLLQQADRRIGLSKAMAGALHDPRNQDMIVHEMRDLVAQRLYALCCGYEDLNDHGALRSDPLMQTAVGRTKELGSSPTLCRLEKRATHYDSLTGQHHADATRSEARILA